MPQMRLLLGEDVQTCAESESPCALLHHVYQPAYVQKCVHRTGEARTKAMAEAAGALDDEDYAFDSFADPGGLIMTSIIEKHLSCAPNQRRLLERAQALKLPGNPLVSILACLAPSLLCPARAASTVRPHNRPTKCLSG